jgi:transposase
MDKLTDPDAPPTRGGKRLRPVDYCRYAMAASRSGSFPSDGYRIILWTLCERSGMARRARDGKAQELAASRTLNPRPEAVVDEGFRSAEFFDARDLVQVKYEMVRRVEADGVSVSTAAGAFGFSRQSYYSAARALDDEGLAGLVPAKPGPRGAHKLTDEVLEHLEGLRAADPRLGAAALAAAVAERFGVTVHRRSIERALARREAATRGPKSG